MAALSSKAVAENELAAKLQGIEEEKTKEGLQVVQEMSRKVKKTKEYPVIYTAATRGVLEY